MQKPCKKSGFNLTEVLITLAVIGVVAMLTYPSVTRKTFNTEMLASLKSTQAKLVDVANLIKRDNYGTLAGAVGSETTPMRDAFAAKMLFTKLCAVGDGNCWHYDYSSHKTLDMQGSWLDGSMSRASAISADGMLYLFAYEDEACSNSRYTANGEAKNCGIIFVDLNGFSKPNIIGRDIFEFLVNKDGIVPHGFEGSDRTDFTTFCNPASNSPQSGEGCAARVLQEDGIKY